MLLTRFLFSRRLLEGANSAVREGKVHDGLVVEEVVRFETTALLSLLLSVHLVALHRVVHVTSRAQAPQGLHLIKCMESKFRRVSSTDRV